MHKTLFIVAAILVLPVLASAQVYNSSTGGYNTGYGHVYGSFGLAMATQNLYNTTQLQMQRLMMEAALKNAGSRPSASRTSSSPAAKPAAMAAPVVRNYGKFRPDATVDTGKTIADALASTPEEKALLKQVYGTVKAAYEKEVAAKGWQNNIAGALTFFIVSNATVYHDSAEPNDETVQALYLAVNQSIDEIPEFGKMANRDKQAFNNVLIAFAAIPLATYAEGKQNGDDATVLAARQLAGQLLEMIMKTSPDNIRFENGTIVFGK